MQEHHNQNLAVNKGSKEQNYLSVLPQILSLVSESQHLVTNSANIVAALKEQFGWWWTGFYWAEKEELYLGAFQGPIACTRIKKGRGVCGASWQQKKTLVVKDVSQFPGHIACSSKSKSQIVVPIMVQGQFIGLLDVDSQHPAHFDEVDQKYLQQLIEELIARRILK